MGGASRGLGSVTIEGVRFGVCVHSHRDSDIEERFAELAKRAGAIVPLAAREKIGATAFEPGALWVALIVHCGCEAGFVTGNPDGALVVNNYFGASLHAIERLLVTDGELAGKGIERATPNVTTPPQLVTLKQMAAIVNRSKSAVEKIKSKLPPPRVNGGAGKPSEWHWEDVRPILAEYFGRPDLPTIWPGDQFRRR